LARSRISKATPPFPLYAFIYYIGKILFYCDPQNMSGIKHFYQKLEITLMILAGYRKKTREDEKRNE
jgi:hypothetical protein